MRPKYVNALYTQNESFTLFSKALLYCKEAESCASVEILLFKRGKPLMSLEGRINDGWIYWPATIIFGEKCHNILSNHFFHLWKHKVSIEHNHK